MPDELSTQSRSSQPTAGLRISIIDIGVILVVIVFALLSLLGRWQGLSPFVDLGDDAANIASFVAARHNPARFADDFLLGQIENYNLYWTIHFPILQFLRNITGDYGIAYLVLYPLHLVVQILGFYWFGRLLFQSRRYAVLFMVLTTIPISMNLGERSGIFFDAVPRFTFQALLPYVLSAAVVWRNQPKRWFLVMVMVGLLVYVHSVSTPAWGFAIWLGFWVFLPKQWTLAQRLGFMFALGMVFLLVIAPFAAHYLGNFEAGVTVDYERVMEIARYRFQPGFLDLRFALEVYLFITNQLLLLGILGIITALLVRQPEERYLPGMIILWAVGLLFVSVVIPMVDHSVAAARQVFPLQVDLIRGLRYTILLSWLFAVWMFQSMEQYWHKRPYRVIPPILLIVLTTVVTLRTMPLMPLSRFIDCVKTGQIVCPGAKQQDYAEIIVYIRDNVPPDAVIAGGGLPVRYIALHPLAYLWKDGGLLIYGNHERLLEWYDQAIEMDAIEALAELDRRAERLIEQARGLNGDYLVWEYSLDARIRAVVSEANADIVLENEHYGLIALSPIP